MFELEGSTVPLWQFNNLHSYKNIKHFVSGRRGGVSKGEKFSLNLSYKVEDNSEDVKENRKRVSDAIGINENSLVFPIQTHSINVAIVESNSAVYEDTDALVCNIPGICISVMSADCVSVLFYDPTKKVVAAAHAGWRGTVGKIGMATVNLMEKQYGSNPADIIACIGPSISPNIYEVGSEVIEAVRQSFGSTKGLIHSETKEGKGFLNLWEANKIQLINAGLRESKIEVAEVCTYIQSEEFFSARKSKNRAGRFAAGIMLC